LVEDVEEGLGVLEILSKVLNSSFLSSFLQVVVDPSDEDFLGWELVEVLKSLISLGQFHDLWAILQGDFLGELQSNELPDATKHHVWNLVDEIVGVNTDHLDTETLGGGDTHLKIFLDLVDVQRVTFVDGSSIDGIIIDGLDKLTEQDTIVEDME